MRQICKVIEMQQGATKSISRVQDKNNVDKKNHNIYIYIHIVFKEIKILPDCRVCLVCRQPLFGQTLQSGRILISLKVL